MASTTARPDSAPATALDDRCAHTLRKLAVEQVLAAGSGHYGFPLGAADLVDELFSRYLRFDGTAPQWPNRDRFVLSAGHGSAMLYAVLHLAGYDLTADDLRAFRTLHSRTPGHPERGETDGVEVTTGPLGQGLANAVGLAIAETALRAQLGADVISHRTVVLASDGDLMEGIAYEAAALAAEQRLGSLIVCYDDNDIVIDSAASSVMSSQGVCDAFAALGWRIVEVADGNDRAALREGLDEAFEQGDGRPTLVRVPTVIGLLSPRAGTSASHSGAPTTEEHEEIVRALGLEDVGPFEVPADVADRWQAVRECGAALRRQWEEAQGEAWDRHARELAEKVAEARERILELPAPTAPVATRVSSSRALAALPGLDVGILGGSADLAGATGTVLADGGIFGPDDRRGANIRFGVREHAMGAIANGITAHSVLRGIGSTFLMFATYEANALRMSAIQRLGAIHVFSHDSILVGEDGPTHQPVEVLPFLRAIPDFEVWRPADDLETRVVWAEVLATPDRPAAIVLSRSGVDQIQALRTPDDIAAGAYVAHDADEPEAVVFATGAEVTTAVDAAQRAAHRVRVLSVPNLERFRDMPRDRREELAPSSLPRICVEASHPMSWYGIARDGDAVIGVSGFGASAPAADVAAEHGMTATAVCCAIERAIQ
ncbi:transketolase-like TK C-terminal-containing protein [Brachybacterium hainanense]|uniref:1-deoxy-D-xylulose-5-phosphate synthase N-terminal domain-containing protein n=1 Tax=Brachybacterium hainanense TaxID=1541174 RepID=A0ABV6R5U4_9MICO